MSTKHNPCPLFVQRFVKMAALMEEGVWLPTDVCVPTASPGRSARKVMITTHLAYILHNLSENWVLNVFFSPLELKSPFGYLCHRMRFVVQSKC